MLKDNLDEKAKRVDVRRRPRTEPSTPMLRERGGREGGRQVGLRLQYRDAVTRARRRNDPEREEGEEGRLLRTGRWQTGPMNGLPTRPRVPSCLTAICFGASCLPEGFKRS